MLNNKKIQVRWEEIEVGSLPYACLRAVLMSDRDERYAFLKLESY